jgi:hypothetical protein
VGFFPLRHDDGFAQKRLRFCIPVDAPEDFEVGFARNALASLNLREHVEWNRRDGADGVKRQAALHPLEPQDGELGRG